MKPAPDPDEVRIHYHFTLPAPTRRRLKDIIERVGLRAVPPWCRTLVIDYDTEPPPKHPGSFPSEVPSAIRAHTRAAPAYRKAWITIHPAFVEDTEAEQEENIAHELAHLPLMPMAHAAEDILAALRKVGGTTYEELADALADEFIRAHEGTACDIAEALARRRA